MLKQTARVAPADTVAEGYPPPLQAWGTVVLLLLLYLLSVFDKNIISLLGENIRHDLGLSDVQLSMLFGPAFAISYSLGALPFGWAMDRYSRRWVLWVGVTIWSLGTVACGLSRGFAQLAASRAFVGVGESVLVPANQSILADMFPPSRLALPFAICSMGVKLGQGLSFAIGGLLVALIGSTATLAVPLVGEIGGWQAILLIVGLPGLFLALLVFLVPEPARRRLSAATPADDVGYRHYLAYIGRHPRFFLGIHLGSILTTMIYSCLLAWTPAHFIRAHHLSTADVGMWLGLVIVAGPLVGLPIHGLITDRLFQRGMRDAHARYLTWMMAAATVPLVAAFTIGNVWLSLALLCLGYTLFGAFGMLGPATLQLMLPGDLRGKAASVLVLVTGLAGMAVGPTIVATISEGLLGDPDKIGVGLAICVGVALPLAACFYALTLKPLAQAYAVAE